MTLFWAITAGFFAGVAGAMGLGGGSVLLIYLTVFAGTPQLQAQGMNLLFFIPIAAFSTVVYAKRGIIQWKRIAIMAVCGALGTFLGSLVLGQLKPQLLRQLFGGLVLLYGLFTLFAPRRSSKKQPTAGAPE